MISASHELSLHRSIYVTFPYQVLDCLMFRSFQLSDGNADGAANEYYNPVSLQESQMPDDWCFWTMVSLSLPNAQLRLDQETH